MSSALRVVVADDSPIFRSTLCQYLNTLDYITVIGEAEDGVEALALVEQLEPDILLLDLSMPNMDGYDVAQYLHTVESPVSVIVLTGHSDLYFEQLMRRGVVACIEKQRAPFILGQTLAELAEDKGFPKHL